MRSKGNNESLISIVVPVYNIEGYVYRCVDSMINQTYRNIEIILVDDGSIDKSGIICDEFANRDKRIKVIHKKNGGLSDARNAGIAAANGEYIGFVDGDDYIHQKMYEILLDACIRNNAQMAMCGRKTVDENGNLIKEMFTLGGETLYTGKEAVEHLLRWDSCDSSACDKLYSRILFDKVRYPLGVMSEDYQVTSRLMLSANRIVHVGYSLYNYVQRTERISHQLFTRKRIDVLKQVDIMTGFILDKFPDLKLQCDYFTGKQLISIQRYAFYNTDPKMRISMIEIRDICKKEKAKVIKNKLFTNKEKRRFLERNFLLPWKARLLGGNRYRR